MKATLNPYLLFNGQTKAAMEYYHAILGGDLTVQTFADAGMSHSEDDKDLVIHAQLTNEDIVIMGSDGGTDHHIEFGNNVALSVVGSDEEALTEVFQKLSDGGKVDLPLAKQFWGDIYGQVTDKFGQHWMVNITAKTSEK